MASGWGSGGSWSRAAIGSKILGFWRVKQPRSVQSLGYRGCGMGDGGWGCCKEYLWWYRGASDLPSLSPSAPCPFPGGIPWSGPCPWHGGEQSPLGPCHPPAVLQLLWLCSAPGSLAGFKQFKPLTFHQDLSQLLKPRHPLSLFNALCFSCSGSKEGL